MAISDIFGFKFRGKSEEEISSVVPPSNNDGSLVIQQDVVAGGWQGFAYDPDATVKTESEQIVRYRQLQSIPEIDSAVDDIINEMIVTDQEDYPVSLQLDNLRISDPIKKKFQESFKEVLSLLNFNQEGHDLVRSWYVDGRQYFHILFKNNDVKQGIAEIRPMDSLKTKKVKNYIKRRNDKGVEVVERIEEFFIYNDRGVVENSISGVKLSTESVAFVHSGLVENGVLVGHLHKAIKPANQLRMLEDAVIIYTLTRAPDRRVFYIDVGNLPKIKAEQYVTEVMNKFKNKLVYNASTGEIADGKKHMSMIEDFWLARRDNGKATEITTLQGSQSLIQVDFVEYFRDKLYQALNVPKSRFQQGGGFSIGRSSEITRDEVKFSKFIGKLRIRYSTLFLDLLKIQLVAKGIIRLDEWSGIKGKIRFDFQKDNYFSELKESEIINSRVQSLASVDPYLGKYYSKKWIQKNVLRLSDEDIAEIESDVKREGQDALPSAITTQVAMMQMQNDMSQQDQSQEAQDSEIEQEPSNEQYPYQRSN